MLWLKLTFWFCLVEEKLKLLEGQDLHKKDIFDFLNEVVRLSILVDQNGDWIHEESEKSE